MPGGVSLGQTIAYSFRPEYAPHKGRVYPCGVLGGSVTPCPGPSQSDESDIFRQIHFQDLAAEFAKKKTRKFHCFEIPSRSMQNNYAEMFS